MGRLWESCVGFAEILAVRIDNRGSNRVRKGEIIEALKELNDVAKQKYKADIKGIFGSFAKGEEDAKSDFDVKAPFNDLHEILKVEHTIFESEKVENKVGTALKRQVKS